MSNYELYPPSPTASELHSDFISKHDVRVSLIEDKVEAIQAYLFFILRTYIEDVSKSSFIKLSQINETYTSILLAITEKNLIKDVWLTDRRTSANELYDTKEIIRYHLKRKIIQSYINTTKDINTLKSIISKVQKNKIKWEIRYNITCLGKYTLIDKDIFDFSPILITKSKLTMPDIKADNKARLNLFLGKLELIFATEFNNIQSDKFISTKELSNGIDRVINSKKTLSYKCDVKGDAGVIRLKLIKYNRPYFFAWCCVFCSTLILEAAFIYLLIKSQYSKIIAVIYLMIVADVCIFNQMIKHTKEV